MVSIIAVFVLLLVIFNAPAPSRRSSSSASRTSSSSSVSSSSSGGGSSGSSFGTGGSGSGSAKSEKEDTTITYVVGEERSLTAEGPIYFAPRQADMNDFVAGTDADGLMEAGKLLVLEDGTNVALVKVLQNMAFVDILDGEQAGSRGYVEISVIR